MNNEDSKQSTENNSSGFTSKGSEQNAPEKNAAGTGRITQSEMAASSAGNAKCAAIPKAKPTIQTTDSHNLSYGSASNITDISTARRSHFNQKEHDSLWEFVQKGLGTQKAINKAIRRLKQIQVEHIREQEPSITCPKCGMKSFNPCDVLHRYCGNCHAFHGDLEVLPKNFGAKRG